MTDVWSDSLVCSFGSYWLLELWCIRRNGERLRERLGGMDATWAAKLPGQLGRRITLENADKQSNCAVGEIAPCSSVFVQQYSQGGKCPLN